jgi:macrodomain Ter protein organizer (MatP/YcbG family)
MPDIKKYKSVAVPIPTWKKLGDMAKKNHRSPAQQIAFLVDAAEKSPKDADVLTMYARIKNDG